MKVIGLKDTNLDACVSEAQRERIVITRNGKPLWLLASKVWMQNRWNLGPIPSSGH